MGALILPPDLLTDRFQSIYTFEGWRKFVEAPVLQRPPALTLEAYRHLSADQRTAYDAERRLYVARFGPLKTEAMESIGNVFDDQIMLNVCAPVDQVKTGLVIDGDAMHGKTTIAKALARRFERSARKKERFPDPAVRDAFIPVVHVTLQRDTTPKGLAQAICAYLHVPLRGRETEAQLVQAVHMAVERHSILLFVIDDIHFLQVNSQAGQETSNFLKSLMSLTGATFVYVGIDVEQKCILREHGASRLRSSQTASRFIWERVWPYEQGSALWQRLLWGAEQHLCLLSQPAGSLEAHSELIFELTSGSIGSLMNLLRKAALQAIGGQERVTEKMILSSKRDFAATMQGSRRKA